MKSKDKLQHVINEIKYVLETDALTEDTVSALEQVVHKLEGMQPPAGVKRVEVRTMFGDPEKPMDGYADIVLCAGDGEEVHFRVSGTVAIIKEEENEDEKADRAFAEQLGVPYEEVRGFNEFKRLQH